MAAAERLRVAVAQRQAEESAGMVRGRRVVTMREMVDVWAEEPPITDGVPLVGPFTRKPR